MIKFKNKFPAATTISTIRNKVFVYETVMGQDIEIGYGYTYFDLTKGNPYNTEMFTKSGDPLPSGMYTIINTDEQQLVVVPLRVQ